jgi:ribonuclease HI
MNTKDEIPIRELAKKLRNKPVKIYRFDSTFKMAQGGGYTERGIFDYEDAPYYVLLRPLDLKRIIQCGLEKDSPISVSVKLGKSTYGKHYLAIDKIFDTDGYELLPVYTQECEYCSGLGKGIRDLECAFCEGRGYVKPHQQLNTLKPRANPKPAQHQSPQVVTIYTDGSVDFNHEKRPGGWAALLMWGEYQRELFGNTINTSNNRMEMQAAIYGIKALKNPCEVILYTDSEYLAKGINNWLKIWVARQYKNSKGDEIANRDLWEEILKLMQIHSIKTRWVEGHSGNKNNDYVDNLARETMRKIRDEGIKQSCLKKVKHLPDG